MILYLMTNINIKRDRDFLGSQRSRIVSLSHKGGLKVIALFVLVYSIVWSYIVLARFFELRAFVYDLGVVSNRLWWIYHTHWTLPKFLSQFLYQGVQFVISPLGLLRSNIAALITQTVCLAIPAIFLYLISEIIVDETKISLSIAASYLLFFPLAGVNWFDFHVQAFFMVLFVPAYYLWLRKHYLASTVLFSLSGLVRFPYSVFPAIFAFTEIIQISYTYKTVHSLRGFAVKTKYAIALLMVSTIFLVSGYFVLKGSFSGILSLNSSILPLNQDLGNKFLTIVVLLGPLLFIPVLSPRWTLCLVPFFVSEFAFNRYGYYSYPYVIILQYSVAVIPFLYLGLIEGLSKMKEKGNKAISKSKGKKTPISKVVRVVSGRYKVFAYVSLLVVIGSGVFFEPYGVMNHSTGPDSYNYNILNVPSTTQYISLMRVVKLIPQDSSLMVQDNLPEVLPGPLGFNLTLPGEIADFGNSSIIRNSFPYAFGGIEKNVSIDYVLVDFNDLQMFGYSVNPYFPDLSQILDNLLASGYYGIDAYYNGFVLLKRNYSSQPTLYSSMMTFEQNQLTQSFKNTSTVGGFETWNIAAIPLIQGRYTYNVNYSIFPSPTIQMNGYVSADFCLYSSNKGNLFGQNVSLTMRDGNMTNGSLKGYFDVTGFTENVKLAVVYSSNIDPSFRLNGITITRS